MKRALSDFMGYSMPREQMRLVRGGGEDCTELGTSVNSEGQCVKSFSCYHTNFFGKKKGKPYAKQQVMSSDKCRGSKH